MGSNSAPDPGPAIDTSVRPAWQRTGNKHFPYAAHQSGRWWMLRANYGFPEHDMYTLFIDDLAVADITADTDDSVPLLAGIAALHFTNPGPPIPLLDQATADKVVSIVAAYINYESEHGDPCMFCSSDG